MFFWRKPAAARLERIRAASAELPLSHAWARDDAVPPGYVLDHNRARLGQGGEAFDQACQALRDWRMLQLGWLAPAWPAPLAEGEVVGTLARVSGLWTLNLCRIVQVIDEPLRFGLTWATLAGHAERGQERFLVELVDGEVWYDLRAISRPGHWLTWLGYPLVRRLQKRFARDSLRVMRGALVSGQAWPECKSA